MCCFFLYVSQKPNEPHNHTQFDLKVSCSLYFELCYFNAIDVNVQLTPSCISIGNVQELYGWEQTKAFTKYYYIKCTFIILFGLVLLQNAICLGWITTRLPVIVLTPALMFIPLYILISTFQYCRTHGNFFYRCLAYTQVAISDVVISVISRNLFCYGYRGLHRHRNAEMCILSSVCSLCQSDGLSVLKYTSVWGIH